VATRKKKAKKKASKKTTKKKTAKKKAEKRQASKKRKASIPKKPTPPTEVKAGGRPTKYIPDWHCPEAERLCVLMFATDEQLAEYFEVTNSTIYEWKKKHPTFSDAIKRGKAKADGTIEQSLFHRAKGYDHPDTHITNYYGKIILTPITKHYPPSEVAQIFWLTNRKRGEWKRNLDQFGDNSDTPPPLKIEYKVKKAVSDVTVTRGT